MEKVLIISPQVPEFDKYAGWMRLSHIIDILSRHYEVFFVAEGAHPGYAGRDDRYTRFLKERGVRLFIGDHRLHEILLNNRFKFAMIEFFTTAEKKLSTIRALQPGLEVILDTVDVHFLREQMKAEHTKDVNDLEEAKRTKIREMEVCRRVEAIFTVTPFDEQLLRREDANLVVEVIPTVHSIEFDERKIRQRDKSKLLFVGGFRHLPNVDAIRYFCCEILPLVRENNPNIQLLIAGEHRPEDVKELSSNNVKFLGYVPDLANYLQNAYISVAPLRYGAGMKGKIGEALAHGLPVVTTSIGIQGMSLRHGEDVLVADAPEAFAECIKELLSDEDLYTKLSHNGPEFIRHTCTPEVVEKKLVNFFENGSQKLLQKKRDRLSRERYELTFDTYQRYQMTADILEHLDKTRKRILDVGDSHGFLTRFLPDEYVVAIDQTRRILADDFVLGNAVDLPFRNGKFDFVVNMDVLEHVPRDERRNFLDECARVANRGMILGAPFYEPMTEEGEILINEFHRDIHGKDHPWLLEHIANRLPDLEETVQHLENAGFSVSVLPNGYTPHWLFMMGINNFLAHITNGEDTVKRLNAYYNKHFYSYDNMEPCYRRIIVALRGAACPDIKELYPESDQIKERFHSDLKESFQALLNLETLRLLHENEPVLRDALKLRDRMIARDAIITMLLSKWPGRVLRRIKNLLRPRQQ